MNLEFLILSIIIGRIVDFIFQFDWQARNKSKWSKGDDLKTSTIALFSHAWIYAFLTTFIVGLLLQIDYAKNLIVLCVLLFSHMIIDSRFPVKWIMRMHGKIKDEKILPLLSTEIDQRLHEIILLILSFVLF